MTAPLEVHVFGWIAQLGGRVDRSGILVGNDGVRVGIGSGGFGLRRYWCVLQKGGRSMGGERPCKWVNNGRVRGTVVSAPVGGIAKRISRFECSRREGKNVLGRLEHVDEMGNIGCDRDRSEASGD